MAAADRARARLVDGMRDVLHTLVGGGDGRAPAPAVEEAFRIVPRHLFLPGVPISRAYADEAVAVQAVDGVTTSSASQPSMMAIMLGQLDLRPGHRVLEVGAGTGYNAALMQRLVGPDGRVVAVDIDPDLVAGAARHLDAAGVTGVQLHCADGARGYPADAPYDRIVLTVGSGDVRPEWVAQLAPGGRLLLPLAVRGTQLSVALDLCPDGLLRSDSLSRCAFVRLRGVGAHPDPGLHLCGLTVLPADAPAARPEGVRAALRQPGGVRPTPLHLGPADQWDGFGLWLALTEPGTCRLLASAAPPDEPPDDPHDDPTRAPHETGEEAVDGAAVLGLGPGRATVGLVTDGPEGAGLATVAVDRAHGGAAPGHGPWPAQVRAFGPGGDGAADRLLAAASSWLAAGRPTAVDLRLTVVPRGASAPLRAGVAVVEKEHCRVVVHLRTR